MGRQCVFIDIKERGPHRHPPQLKSHFSGLHVVKCAAAQRLISHLACQLDFVVPLLPCDNVPGTIQRAKEQGEALVFVCEIDN